MNNTNWLPFQQPINYILVTGAGSTLPVSLFDVKIWLKVPSTITADDTLITALIKSATATFEKITGRDLINKTYKTYLDSFPCVDGLNYYTGISFLVPKYNDNGIVLRKSKLQSITSIQYYLDGVLTTWDSSNYYITDLPDYSAIYLVADAKFPTNIDIRKQSIVINFVAGYGVNDTYIPEDAKQALLQFITYLYENRGDCANSRDMQAGMDLFSQFKIIDF
jgi:hypothetical protein